MTRSRKAVILGLLTALLGLTVGFTPYGYDLEETFGLSLLFKVRGPRPAPPEVIIVALDRESADRLALPSDPRKWPRSFYARIVQSLAKEGASVIAIDLVFDEAGPADQDQLFARAIKEASNVVLLQNLKREVLSQKDPSDQVTGALTIDRMVSPIPVLAQEAASLASFPLPRVPATVRQYWTFKDGSDDFATMPVTVFQVFSLPMYDDLAHLLKLTLEEPEISHAANDQTNRSSVAEAQTLIGWNEREIIATRAVHELTRRMKDMLGNETLVSKHLMKRLENRDNLNLEIRRIGILQGLLKMYEDGNSRYLNFYGPPRTITTVPYFQAIEPPRVSGGNGRDVDFKGKVVFIGLSEISPYEQMDTYRTVFSKTDGLDLSGVEICATAFANLIEDIPIQPIDLKTHLIIVSMFGLAVGMLCFMLRPLIAMVCSLGLIALYGGFALRQFRMTGSWYPIINPIGFQVPFAFFGAVLWKYFDTWKLEAAHAQLKEMNAFKSQLLSHVSHELKTPISSIKGFADNMLDGLTGELQEKQREYLDRVRVNADRLARMITNLLDLARIESDAQHLDRVQLRLFDLVEEVVEQLRPIATSKRLTLVTDCPDREIRVLADSDKFIQVMTNLLDNAIKFTPEGGRITVAVARREPECIAITVTDTGEGIPVEAIAKLFEPFYQASRKSAIRQKGLGLGLSIVKTLVELHGGTISVRSEVGKGSEFCILIPALREGEE